MSEITLNIPTKVISVVMSVGILCPQDSMSCHSITILEDIIFGLNPLFFRKETEHMSRNEEEFIIKQLIIALGRIGFHQKGNRRQIEFLYSFHIIFERQLILTNKDSL